MPVHIASTFVTSRLAQSKAAGRPLYIVIIFLYHILLYIKCNVPVGWGLWDYDSTQRKSNFHSCTVGKWNYFTGYGILLHELPVVAVCVETQPSDEAQVQTFLLYSPDLRSVQLQNLDGVKYGINLVK